VIQGVTPIPPSPAAPSWHAATGEHGAHAGHENGTQVHERQEHAGEPRASATPDAGKPQVAGADGAWPLAHLAALHAHLCGSATAGAGRTGRAASGSDEGASAGGAAAGGGQRWAWETLAGQSWGQLLQSWRTLARSTSPQALLHQPLREGLMRAVHPGVVHPGVVRHGAGPQGKAGGAGGRQGQEGALAPGAYAPLTLVFIFIGRQSLPHYVLQTVAQVRQ